MNHERNRAIAALIALGAAVLAGGCSSIGPKTINRDRFDYVMAISESWKRQMLVNLLKTRYLDIPVFMDVSSVINSYSMEGEIDLEFSWKADNTQTVGGTGSYTDKPTITYSPLTGQRFTRSLLMPIPVSGILMLMQSGIPADNILRVCTVSIGGMNNRESGLLKARDADPDFYEVLTRFRRVQAMNGLEFRNRMTDEGEKVFMIVREPRNEAESEAMRGLLDILNLDSGLQEYTVVFGRFPTKPNEITILSRSMMQIMMEYASFIDVPESDVKEGRVYEGGSKGATENAEYPPIIRIRTGTSKPDDAFVAVEYRDHWFWIDDRDAYSKSAFMFLMILFSSTERGAEGQTVPVLTVPTG